MNRIQQQLSFLIEIDRLKGVLRRTTICDASRQENSAEHSWHLAMMAAVLTEHAGKSVDGSRVIRMVLVHDLVEIDAGDTFAYDTAANNDRAEREVRAANRIFGLLPDAQGKELRALWDEFELGETAEARVAVALDRMQPLLLNHHTNGGSWRTHGVTRSAVLRRMDPIRTALPSLWPIVREIVEQNCSLGHIARDM